jgi:hypothetical protein
LPTKVGFFTKPATSRFAKMALPTIALGLANKLLLMLVAALFPSTGDAPFLLDLGSRLSWSVIVCAGLAAGIAFGRGRLAAGISGLVAAPIAFDLARAVRRGVVGYLQLIETTGSPSPLAIGAIKGVEYACLGVGLAWLGRSGRARAIEYVGAGLIAGVGFGGAILALDVRAGISATSAILVWLVNELLFPIGCALVLYRLNPAKR